MFLEEVRKVASDYPELALEDRIVDAMAAHRVRDASQIDVIVPTSFYCAILSDLASELSGGLGLAGSINVHETPCAAQARHGSAPDIAGRDRANPTSPTLSPAMMLEWFAGHARKAVFREAAATIDAAVDGALAAPDVRTADPGGRVTTRSFAQAVADRVRG